MTVSEKQLQDMVQDLWDREQIRQCLNRYARGVDRLDRDLILSAYHPDAIDEHGKFVGGPVDFAEWVLEQQERVQLSHHHCLLNHSCEFDGDTAYTETYYTVFAMYREGQSFKMSGGRYADRFEKRNGEWKIAFRICLRDWAMMDERPDMNDLGSLSSTRGSLTPEVRAFMNAAGVASKRDRTDPSYWRPLKADPERIKAYARLKAGAKV